MTSVYGHGPFGRLRRPEGLTEPAEGPARIPIVRWDMENYKS